MCAYQITKENAILNIMVVIRINIRKHYESENKLRF